MSESTVARRYANALYQEAERQALTQEVDADVALIRASIERSSELARFFESPVISRTKKDRVITALFAERTQALTLAFMRLLVEKHREHLFARVVRAYESLRDERNGIVEARVRVSHTLSEQERESLRRTVEALTGYQARLSVDQDPELLGGVVIRVGDTVYDSSVRHQLESLRDHMRQGSYRLN